MSGDELPDIRPEDALQVAQRSLQKANELERLYHELEDDLEAIADDLAQVNLRLSAQDEDRAYDDLSRDAKVGMVREYLFDRATDGRGRTLDYSDVQEKVFDGEPSPRHCYDLMQLAAQADGFEVRDPAGRNRHLRIDVQTARRSWAFCSGNKTASEGVR